MSRAKPAVVQRCLCVPVRFGFPAKRRSLCGKSQSDRRRCAKAVGHTPQSDGRFAGKSRSDRRHHTTTGRSHPMCAHMPRYHTSSDRRHNTTTGRSLSLPLHPPTQPQSIATRRPRRRKKPWRHRHACTSVRPHSTMSVRACVLQLSFMRVGGVCVWSAGLSGTSQDRLPNQPVLKVDYQISPSRGLTHTKCAREMGRVG